VHPDLFTVWEKYLFKFINSPDFKVLEIGCKDGESTCWMLDNLLLHPAARITCVDTSSNQVDEKSSHHSACTIAQQFDTNIAKTAASAKVRKIAGIPQIVLRSFIPNSFNLVYINDGLVAVDFLENILLSWRLIKVGGIAILANDGVQDSSKAANTQPKAAVDAFLSIFSSKVRLLHQGHQVLIEKTAE
jgi:predicted O-methyltransferase YrrM